LNIAWGGCFVAVPGYLETRRRGVARQITEEEKQQAKEMLARARAAMKAIEDYDQARVDRLCQAVAWATANETTFTRLAQMGVDESGLGDRAGRPGKRFKILGILRDVLRQKSMGVIEELPEKGIVKYGKPAGVVASLIPSTNPALTPPGVGIYCIKCKDAVIFSPHPLSKNTTLETIRVMRAALAKQGAPEDLIQCVERPSIPLAQELMAICDLTTATGGQQMVRAAYSSGKPAYGVGAGNSTMVIDETADIEEAAHNTLLSKTSDFGSGCSADGNLVVDSALYDAMLAQLRKEGGYVASEDEKVLLAAAMWNDKGQRTLATIACNPQKLAAEAGFQVPDDCKFIIVEQEGIGSEHWFSHEKLTTVLAIFRYDGFDEALDMVRRIYDVGGKGHSCGIYSFDDDHIHRLAQVAPVSRMMVRQPQSKANAGAFNNGMPMTSSLGCGVWGGNITNDNISLKHYMNVTWVSRLIPEDRPTDEELFGEFYQSETF
jgi:sulfoacetaldehyde dehydrogenase